MVMGCRLVLAIQFYGQFTISGTESLGGRITNLSPGGASWRKLSFSQQLVTTPRFTDEWSMRRSGRRSAPTTVDGVPKQPRTWTATTSRAELSQDGAGFARRFKAITDVLAAAGVAPSKDISITYSSKVDAQGRLPL